MLNRISFLNSFNITLLRLCITYKIVSKMFVDLLLLLQTHGNEQNKMNELAFTFAKYNKCTGL